MSTAVGTDLERALEAGVERLLSLQKPDGPGATRCAPLRPLGHIAAWEQPHFFTDELRATFRTLR